MIALGLATLFVVGILAGGVGGLLGSGGCVLMMPIIRFGFHFSPALAVGTTLTSVPGRSRDEKGRPMPALSTEERL